MVRPSESEESVGDASLGETSGGAVKAPLKFLMGPCSDCTLWCNNPTKNWGTTGGGNMVGTVALVMVFTLTALAVVLYAAYCEAGEDLPCKKSKRHAEMHVAHARSDRRMSKS